MSGEDLLPPHSGPAETTMVAAVSEAFAIPVDLASIWRPGEALSNFLPWLAWALSVDDWDPAWPEETKRRVIAASVDVHRAKGTLWGVRHALRAMGYGDAMIIEDRDLVRIGDPGALIGGYYAHSVTGEWVIGPSDPHWADYWVILQQPVRRADAERLAQRLSNVAPVRCRLRGITLAGAYYTIGDGLWVVGDDIAVGNIYFNVGE